MVQPHLCFDSNLPLKENIMLQSDLLDLKANFDGSAKGVILESRIDKGKGSVSTVLVIDGS